jgi:putative SOS response-associated peptidase YedK
MTIGQSSDRSHEWHDAPDGKQPYHFTRRDGAPITIAGLWDE